MEDGSSQVQRSMLANAMIHSNLRVPERLLSNRITDVVRYVKLWRLGELQGQVPPLSIEKMVSSARRTHGMYYWQEPDRNN